MRADMPKRMSFFWVGRMSWLRYLTLATFRRFNPDWEVHLYTPSKPVAPKQWTSGENSDNGYRGRDYRELLPLLNIKQHEWTTPIDDVAPAQACDLFQWELLADGSGFYADMDILWVRSIEPVRQAVCNADAVFCLENGAMAIGFFASNHRQGLFADIWTQAVEAGHARKTEYQCYGTHAVYEAAFGNAPIGSLATSGFRAIEVFCQRYPELRIVILPTSTVYPFDWRRIAAIFQADEKISGSVCGVHWFGGSGLAQEFNGRLTEDNWRNAPSNTITSCLRGIFQ